MTEPGSNIVDESEGSPELSIMEVQEPIPKEQSQEVDIILEDFPSKLLNDLPGDLPPVMDSQPTLELVPVNHSSAKHVVRTSTQLISLKHRSMLNHVYPKDFHATIHIL